MNRYSQRDILVLAGVALLFLYTTGMGRQAMANPMSLVATLLALAIRLIERSIPLSSRRKV